MCPFIFEFLFGSILCSHHFAAHRMIARQLKLMIHFIPWQLMNNIIGGPTQRVCGFVLIKTVTSLITVVSSHPSEALVHKAMLEAILKMFF